MSFVTLILIKNKQLQTISAHYSVIKKIIEYCDFGIETVKIANKTEIDAGYIIVDCDRKMIVDAQNAFHTNNLLTEFERVIV